MPYENPRRSIWKPSYELKSGGHVHPTALHAVLCILILVKKLARHKPHGNRKALRDENEERQMKDVDKTPEDAVVNEANQSPSMLCASLSTPSPKAR